MLIHSDNTLVVSYINHQWVCSCPLCKLACQILLWSQGKLLSLRAAYIPGVHNIGADILSRLGLRHGEWRLHPEVVELIWKEFGQAQVDMIAPRATSHCPLWFSSHASSSFGLDAMVQTWPRLRLYAFPPIALLPESWRSLPGPGSTTNYYFPPTRTVETVGLASEGAQFIDSGLSTEVAETILHSRAPSTRKLYALKWRVFTSWCSDHQLDPVDSPVVQC